MVPAYSGEHAACMNTLPTLDRRRGFNNTGIAVFFLPDGPIHRGISCVAGRHARPTPSRQAESSEVKIHLIQHKSQVYTAYTIGTCATIIISSQIL